MTLLFTWDCTVLARNEPLAFFCSHDEWNSFFVPPGFDAAALLDESGNVLYRQPETLFIRRWPTFPIATGHGQFTGARPP
jgi:hypothetical protein